MAGKILAMALVLGGGSAFDGGADDRPRTVVWGEAATEVGAGPAASPDLWVTIGDLTRVTGFVLKPQGVCREEVCFPLPKARKSEFLTQRSNGNWFNLSAFARLLNRPAAHDEPLSVWYFGDRPDQQGGHIGSLQAPDFSLRDREGKKHSLSDFRGKKVLLITWASW